MFQRKKNRHVLTVAFKGGKLSECQYNGNPDMFEACIMTAVVVFAQFKDVTPVEILEYLTDRAELFEDMCEKKKQKEES